MLSPLCVLQFEEFVTAQYLHILPIGLAHSQPLGMLLQPGVGCTPDIWEEGRTLPALSRNAHSSRENPPTPVLARSSFSPSLPRSLLRTSWGHASLATYPDCFVAVSVTGDRKKMRSDSLQGQTQSHDIQELDVCTPLGFPQLSPAPTPIIQKKFISTGRENRRTERISQHRP